MATSFTMTGEEMATESQSGDTLFLDAETREDGDDRMGKDDSPTDVAFIIQERESLQESPVFLSARLDPSYDDLDSCSRLANVGSFYRSSIEDSPTTTTFVRQEQPHSLPPFLSDACLPRGKRDKPSLLRSLAWSQDSQEERRLSKRLKEDTVVSTDLKQQPNNNSGQVRRNSSPTLVHWEEKIEGMEISDILRKAVQHSPPDRR